MKHLFGFLLLCATFLGLSRAQYSSRNYTRTSYTSSIVPVNRFRYECRNIFPSRSDIVPHGVVFSGKVEDIKQDNDGNDDSYMASVHVRRVFHGPKNLRKARVNIAGFGSNKEWCYSNVKRGESWIFILSPITYPDYFRLNSSLIKINLNNLEKIDAIVADEPYRKMTTVTDLPCEKKYCPNSAICLEDKFSPDGTKCECLSSCKPNYAPVCGSNDQTYNNECELRMKTCLQGKNVFIKSLGPCKQAYQSPRHTPSTTVTYRPVSPSAPSAPSGPSSSSSSSSYSYRTNYSGPPRTSQAERPPYSPYSPSYSTRTTKPPQTQRERTYTRTQSTTVNRYQY